MVPPFDLCQREDKRTIFAGRPGPASPKNFLETKLIYVHAWVMNGARLSVYHVPNKRDWTYICLRLGHEWHGPFGQPTNKISSTKFIRERERMGDLVQAILL